MKARTSYHDLVGSIEADVTYRKTNHDPKLGDALKHHGIDPNLYFVVGLHFFSGYQKGKDRIEFTIYVEDLKDSNKLKKVRMELSIGDFFGLFQQLDFYLFNQFYNHDDLSNENVPEIESDEE